METSTRQLRFLVLSASTGACLLYHDFGGRDGGIAGQGMELAMRMHGINQLLLQASGTGDDVSGSADQSAAVPPTGPATATRFSGGGGSSTTILGAGAKRLSAAASRCKAPHACLALRQWHLDSEQWHLAEDPETDVVAALSVPCSWGADAAAYLVRGLRDAFVQANRPQLLALAASARSAAATGPAGASATGVLSNFPGAGVQTSHSGSLSGPQPSQLPQRPPFHAAAPAPALLTLQALKLVCRLAQEAQDALLAGGLRPCWLYFAHVDSLMCPQPESPVGAEGGASAAGGAGASGGAGEGGRKKSGLLKSMLGLLGGGKDRDASGDKKPGKGRVKPAAGGGDGAGGAAPSGAGAAAGPGGEHGPVGHLQHLVLPSEEQRRDPGHVEWDATSIAAAVLQVRPPAEQPLGHAAVGQGGGVHDSSAAGEEGPQSFPGLEDVELELELQFGGGSVAPRRFSVMGVRLQHVLGVVAVPSGAGTDGSSAPAGSLSRVRHLLRPSLGPMSTLFDCLAQWAPQEEVAAHRLLLRLLE